MLNNYIKTIDELGICGCGKPGKTYKEIHEIMTKAKNWNLYENNEWDIPYYDFIIYQLNNLGFLEHGCSIYSSWLTDEGEILLKALNKMSKFDYDYEDFNNHCLTEIKEKQNEE